MTPDRPPPKFPSPPALARSGGGLALALALAACAGDGDGAQARAGPARLVSAGEHVAERNCGQCHALGDAAASPLAEAPPFDVLRTTYDRAQMEQVISQRMHVVHPRMPKLELEVDEVGEFLDYWQTLKPRSAARMAR